MEFAKNELIGNRLIPTVSYDIPENVKFPVVVQDKVSTELKHDYFSVYCYGRTFKIVYHKVGYLAHKKRRKVQKIKHSEDERFASSISRSKSRIFELASCNEFEYFCTFTQDEKKRDRFNLDDFRKDFTQLIRNLNRSREEKIKYLLIPEKHKNGAWHMHGLIMGLTDKDLTPFSLSQKLPIQIIKSLKKGEKVYNWSTYSQKFGYFTATPIKDDIACSKYITKYISKDLSKATREDSKHLFFASQGLKGKECLIKNCFEYCPIKTFDFENDYVKVATFSIDEAPEEFFSLQF